MRGRTPFQMRCAIPPEKYLVGGLQNWRISRPASRVIGAPWLSESSVV